jgi:hypothetical protein
MWVRRRASISRNETVHTVLGVRFDWDEAMEAKVEKYQSALWTLLNEFGVMPNEREILGCSEADEWLSRLRDCLSVEDASQRQDCVRQWSLRVPLPDSYTHMVSSERLKWSLVEYVLGCTIAANWRMRACCVRCWRGWRARNRFWAKNFACRASCKCSADTDLLVQNPGGSLPPRLCARRAEREIVDTILFAHAGEHLIGAGEADIQACPRQFPLG